MEKTVQRRMLTTKLKEIIISYVYWIKSPKHSDVTSEGYVGITSRPVSTRYRQHVNLANTGKGYALHAAIRKYSHALEVVTLVEGSLEYCQLIENKLRPSPGIGYNCAPGGASTTLGCQHSEATKKKVSLANKGRKWTDAQRKASVAARSSKPHYHLGKTNSEKTRKKISESRLLRNELPWNNSASIKSNWSRAEEIKDLLASGCTHADILRRFNLDRKSGALVKIINKIKDGWIPSEDNSYMSWLEEYKENYGT